MSDTAPDPLAPTRDTGRDHDVVVHGATGFVGALTAEYLRDHAPPGSRIALSGRDRGRLLAARDDLGEAAATWPVLVVDSLDHDDMARLAASTRVVATTVGPYRRLGLPLVEACAAAGTHYADLTGEVPFMRAAIDAADEVAGTTGARIVHACGFDSVPSDIGVLLLASHASAHDLGVLAEATLVLRAVRGGISGGTIDSVRGLVDDATGDRGLRRLLADPYALSPDRDLEPDRRPGGGRRADRDVIGVHHDARLGGWLGPHPMATVNTRVVRRSNALLDHGWGPDLRYREVVATGGLPFGPALAGGLAAGSAALAAGLAFPPTRAVLDRVLPDPGDGPDARTRRRGLFHVDVHATTSTGARLRCEIRVPGDPGYGATRVMLGEAALALAGDPTVLPARAGVLTPATGIGHELARRLVAAGHDYRVVIDT